MLLSKAKAEAQDLMARRTKEVSEIESQITKLGLTKKSYLAKIRALVESHLEMIDQFDEAPRHDTRETLEVTDSADVTLEARETVVATDTAEPHEIDEHDDDSDMVDSGTRTDLEESVPATAATEADEEEAKPIDPELAAALENYQTSPPGAEATDTPPPPSPQSAAYGDPGRIVETNTLAEDVPDGFIAKEGDLEGSSRSSERTPVEPHGDEPLDPATMAKNLDQVAAKFEEEMDRAQKS